MKHILIIFGTTALLACTIEKAKALEVAIAATIEGHGTPIVVGITNLPDGSKLLITLSRRQANYSAQDHATVERGKFSAGPFSARGSALPPGDYEVEVVFPLAHTQPSIVRQMVGEKNEKLEGRLVEKGQFGTTAKRIVRVNIGGAASPEADKKARADEEVAMKKWRLESCEWISRVTKSPRPVADCVRELERR